MCNYLLLVCSFVSISSQSQLCLTKSIQLVVHVLFCFVFCFVEILINLLWDYICMFFVVDIFISVCDRVLLIISFDVLWSFSLLTVSVCVFLSFFPGVLRTSACLCACIKCGNVHVCMCVCERFFHHSYFQY